MSVKSKQKAAFTIAFILRILGWIFAIGALVAKLTNFGHGLAFIYDLHNVSFYILAGGFTELLFQVVKLKGQLDEARK